MEFFTGLYLFYSFVSLYFIILFFLIYFQNREYVFSSPLPEKILSLSIVVPCYNEGESIGETIKNLVASDYKGLKKIIVVDDCSTDDSFRIAKSFEKKFPRLVKVVQTPKNTGCAGGSKNYGAKFVTTDLIGFTDGDSFPASDAMRKMVGFFNDPKVGAVTSRVLVKNRVNWLSSFQSIEYKIIAFTRKLLGFVDGIYVTNGPLSIYRMESFRQVNGFNDGNWTEDIEITWNLVKHGWKAQMSLPALVYSTVPTKFKDWFKQRIRWNVGGIQTIRSYKNTVLRCGMLGKFILPFFVFSWFISIIGFGFLVYRLVQKIVINYLSVSYSIATETAIIQMRDLALSFDVLVFFGVALLVLGFYYTVLALSHSIETDKKHKIYSITGYGLFYLSVYPAVLIASIIAYLRGKNTW